MLDRILKQNPELLSDACMSLWEKQWITLHEYKTYRKKYYKRKAILRRQERIRKFLRRIFHI